MSWPTSANDQLEADTALDNVAETRPPTRRLGLASDERTIRVSTCLTRIFRRAGWWWREKALRPGMIGVATHQSFPTVRRAFSWFKVAV